MVRKTAMVRRITVHERRARLTLRHHLARPAASDDPAGVASDLVALHSTDPASVFLSVWARTAAVDVKAIERALYDERTLMRMLGMRRTMFVVPVDLAPIVQAACTRAIAAQQRRLLVQILEDAGIARDAGSWLRDVEESTFAALVARGEAFAAELVEDEPRLREQFVGAPGKAYESRQNITSRVLFLLSADGRIIRGRPRGSWISSQYKWSPVDGWLPGGLPEWDTAPARAELVRRWLAAFGPGRVADIKWWTGWTAGEVKRAFAEIGAAEVDLDGTPGFVLSNDVDPVPADVEPRAVLLPALDPTVMGWAGREWFLGEHGPALFDRSGNAGPTVWWGGRIVGGWGQRKDGEVAFRLLEDVGAEAAAAVEAEAARLTGWLGEVRVTPRFRTPLEKTLSA